MNILKDKKVKIGLIIFLVILFVVLIIGGISKNRSKEEPAPEEPTNIIINDDVKKQLTKYVTELSTGPYCDFQSTIEFTNDCLFRNSKTQRSNLTETYRLSSLILAIGESKENNIMVGNITIDGKAMYNPSYVNLVEVEKEYSLLYGKNEKFNPESVNAITKYNIKYDKSKEKFFYQELETTAFMKTYVEAFESTPTTVTVHVRAGYITYELYKYHLYNTKDKNKEIVSVTNREYKEKGIINEENAFELPEYKFTFIKEEETNNLIFTGVELLA